MTACGPLLRRGILRCKSERSSPTRGKNKKNVRFEDCVDLEQAEYAISTDNDRRQCTAYTVTGEVYNPTPQLQLEKQFWLPNLDELQWLTSSQCVQLESVRWYGRAITGVVRVANIEFEKKVQIRYTFDDWASTFRTTGAFSGSPTPGQDQFSFCIFLPYLQLDMKLYFCIKYECAGRVYWDNNHGANYKFVCRLINNNSRNPFFDTDCSIFF